MTQVWDVLSNKEAVDVVAKAPGRATAARALVDCAVRAWRLQYPTSKNDDCAVVCLFLEHICEANGEVEEPEKKMISRESIESVVKSDGSAGELESHDNSPPYVLSHSDTTRDSEIVLVAE